MTHTFCFDHVEINRPLKEIIVDYFKFELWQNETGMVIGQVGNTNGEPDIPYQLCKHITGNPFLCRETAEPMG